MGGLLILSSAYQLWPKEFYEPQEVLLFFAVTILLALCYSLMLFWVLRAAWEENKPIWAVPLKPFPIKKLLIFISEKGILPNLVRDGRNNMKLLAGEGEDLSAYKTIFQIVDERGIVYYDIIDYKGVLYMTWSNADLYIEDIPSYADRPAAKDLIYYTKIGDLTSYL